MSNTGNMATTDSADSATERLMGLSMGGLDTTDTMYKCEDPVRRLVIEADGKYVTRHAETGNLACTPLAVLSADVDKDRERGDPKVVVGDEEDITSRLGQGAAQTFTLPIGVGWNNGGKTAMFLIEDGIVEYRSNIGVPSAKTSAVTGQRIEYMTSYASIGIPLDRYEWMVDSLGGVGIRVVDNERDKTHKGYRWMNANITKGFIPAAIVVDKERVIVLKDATRNLKGVLTNAAQNVIGVLGLEFTLKRARKGAAFVPQYVLSPSLKMLELRDLTDISSPPLFASVEFQTDGKVQTSSRLMSSLSGRAPHKAEAVPTVPGIRIPPGALPSNH